jgi:hypothetical protein
MENSLVNSVSLANGGETIFVYVRNYKKNAFVLSVRIPISGRQLRQKLKCRPLFHVEEFALFIKGRSIPDDEQPVSLQKNTIVHLVDLERTNFPSITINFKGNYSREVIRAKATPNAIIRDVLRNDVQPVIHKG